MAARIPLVINSGAIQELQSGDSLNLGPNASLTSPTIATSMVLSYGTANQVQFLNGSKQLVGDADLTFDGTTLSATNFTSSGTVTLSGATANGVAYLNGSKVLTTGSALTFDGATLRVKGGNANSFYVDNNGSQYTSLNFSNNGTDKAALYWDNTNANFVIGSDTASSNVIFRASNAEQMRLTLTGLGIGDSTPSEKLTVVGNALIRGSGYWASNGNTAWSYFGDSNNRIGGVRGGNMGFYTDYAAMELSAGGGSGASASLQTILFKTGGTTKATLDSSGNLGLGVTPSASWASSSTTSFSYGLLGSLAGRKAGQGVYLSSNVAFNGDPGPSAANGVYLYSDTAAAYSQHGNTHKWFIAPSGTAGNAISFTQAMTLDASGSLLIGQTSSFSSAYKLQIYNSAAADCRLQMTNSGTGNTASDGVLYGIIGSDAYVFNYEAGNVVLGTNATERMRIDSSGNLLVGTTSVVGSSRVTFSNFGSGISNGLALDAANTAAVDSIGFYNPNGRVGAIVVSGSSTAYNTSSDYRLKENIQPMQNALGVVSQLNPVTYTWKADGSDGQGFIAHELQAVVPDCVTGEKDAVDAEGKPVYQGIDTSFLVATLTKAIQELKAELDATKAEVAALKGV